ncbi:MAG: DUF2865 domain-containing protein [Alphaproteobacteria bacterium]|nr:DUF2865 domain-containing protein [Alphaproteobacteria bacterium]
MFGVTKWHEATAKRRFNPRLAIIAVTTVAILSGPGLLAYALVDALYRDLPTNSATPSAVTKALKKSDASRSATNLLSPLAVRKASGVPKPGTRLAPSRDVDNPLKAYLKLRGSPGRLDLAAAYANENQSPAQSGGAVLRTVCVRLCDGYYFPIGYASSVQNLASHEERCQSQCGSPAKLYVYPTPTGSPLQMRDLEGRPYLELANAFRFHTSVDNRCTCQANPWTEASARRHRSYAVAEVANSTVAQAERMPGELIEPAKAPHVILANGAPPPLAIETATVIGASQVNLMGSEPASKVHGVPTPRPQYVAAIDAAATAQSIRLSDRLARRFERASYLAALDLPAAPWTRKPTNIAAKPAKTRDQRSTSLAALKPGHLDDEPEFLLGGPAPTAKPKPQLKKSGVAVAGWSGTARQKPNLSASEILLRNLNPLIR